MPHKPRHKIIDDVIKYWPVIGVLFASLTGIMTTQFIVTAHGKEIESLKATQAKIWPTLTEQKIAQAKTDKDIEYIKQAQVQTLEILKEIRNR